MRGCGLREEGSKARSASVMGVGAGRIVMTGQACQQTTQGSGCSLRAHQREDEATDHCDDTSRQYCSRVLSLASQLAAENAVPGSLAATRDLVWDIAPQLLTHATLVDKSFFRLPQKASESFRNNRPRCLSVRYLELETP